MKNMRKKPNEELWDNKELGASKKHVRKTSVDQEKKLDENLGLQTISIRLQKSLINSLKSLAEEDGIRYQPYVRQILTRHVRQLHHDKREKIKHEKHQTVSR